jgi:tetratricopeptide (TPR) repeat protein
VAVLACIAAAALALQARERQYPVSETAERLLYLQSGPAAGRLALSFDALVADVYWIRTIQHYGRDYKNRKRANRFELLQPLLDLTTTLDPHFLIAYRFGAIFLALTPPDGPGRPDQAIALLAKGLSATPDRWQLAHDIGFIHYLYTGDYSAAADWFRRASEMSNAPEWIGPLAATTLAQGGNRTGARQMLLGLRNSEEEYIRRAAERALAQLGALDAIDELQKRISTFRDRVGRNPSGWGDLVSAGLLPAVPADATMTPFAYDPATGSVSIGPQSPLLPLPPTMGGR